MTSAQIAAELAQNGLCICPNFLGSISLCETRADMDQLDADGQFYRAGTGKGEQLRVQEEVRHDRIRWWDRACANAIQNELWDKLDLLKQALNQDLYLGLNDFEGHYAIYPEGGFYRRHLDAFRDGGTRVVSFILYLNRDWQSADGGELRIYAKDGSHIGVQPVGGTMVCFLSQESEHEVMPSFRTRSSFVGWFGQKNFSRPFL